MKTRSTEAGYLLNAAAGRRGRTTNSPPQLGHFPAKISSLQRAQNVHSNEQILASGDSGGRSTLQHSQFGLN